MQKRNMVLFALIVTIICIGMSTISAADMADVNATAIASENAIDDVATIEDAPEQDIEVVTSEQNNLGNEFYTNENSLGMVEDLQSDDLQSTTRTSVTVSNWADLKTYCEKTSDYEITLSDGIYTPTGEIIVKNNVVINGNSNAVIGGTASNPCSVDYNLFKFAYYSNKGLTFNNLNFQHINTTANSIIYLNGLGSSYINDCDFTNCYAQQSHSSIIYLNFGMANVTGCNFKNSNTSFGVITISGWTSPKMNVTSSTFEDNYASVEPGAINNCNNLIVMDSIFKRNTASWWAGAIHTHNNANTKIYGSTFEDNVANWNGGSLFTYSNLEVYNSTFISNQATGFGGAIGACDNVSHFNITVDNCTFIDNSAYAGGAIGVMDDGNLTVTDSTFKGNSATTGTAIYAVSDDGWGTPHVVIVGNEFYDYDSNTVVYDDINAVFENNTYPSTASSVQLLGLANPFSNDKLQEENPTVIYVKTDGDDSNDGLTADTAVKTIAKAVELIANEGTIIISEGVYAGEEIHFYDKKLTIVGANCENTIIAGEDIKFIRNGQNQGYSFDGFIHLYNITFKNLHVSMDANATLENCIFDNADIICLNSYPVEEVSGEFFINQNEYIFIDIKHSVFLNHENGNSYFTFGEDAENAINGINMMIAMGAPMQDMVDQNPLFIVNNCYFNAEILDSELLIDINNCIVPTIVDSDSVIYDGETLNDFTVKLVSVNAEGVESDFDATGFPSIPVTFTVDGVATESAFVDGIAKLSIPLTTNQAVIKATVGSKEFTFTLPEMPPVEVESPEIDDSNYADYFSADGKILPHVTITDGKVILGDLTNKDIVIDRALNIVAKEGSQLVNCTITLNGDASDSTITGLNFNNFNKNALVIEDGIDNVKIEENQITVNTGEEPSIAAVSIVGYSKNIAILNNIIDMTGDAENLYGICAIAYPNGHYSEANSVVDIRNNNITVTGSNMVEALYLTNIENSVIDNNIVVVSSTGSSDAYGIQVADMSYWASMDTLEPSPFRPPNNINITNNQFAVKGKNMVYGITVISTAMMDMDSDTAISYPESEIIISNNIVDVESDGGVVAIGGQSLTQSKITDNNITATGGSIDGITTVDTFGVHNTAILLIDDTGDYGSGKECKDVEITGNIIDSTADSIQVETPESATVENNHILRENGAIIVNDDTYQYLFDEEGNFVYETEDGTTVLIDVLTSKNMIFAQPLNIKSKDDSSVITNGTITLTADASGSNVTGLKIVLDNVPAATYPGLAVITLDEGIQDVVLEDNSIQWVTADSPAKATAMGIKIVGGENGVSSDIKLINNEITISGDAANMYGIDCYSNPWNYDGAITNLVAQGNKITLNGIGMVEGIYLSRITDSVVKDNTIETESTGGNAYGIGTDNIHDVSVEGNTIVAKATAEGYNATGISLYESDINEKANDITVSGSTAQKIKSDDKSVVYDLVDEDNYNQFFDDEGNYNNEAENITLADLSNKDLTFASPVNVKGAPGAKLTDVTIKLTADASGSRLDGLTIVYEGADLSYSHCIIDIMGGAKDIALTNNVINVTATNEDGTAMAIYLSGNTGDDLISNVTISGNEINMNGTAKYLYAVDAVSNNWASDDTAVSGIEAYDNEINLEGTYYVAGFYLSHTTDSDIHDNVINGLVTGADGGVAYGIASDCASKMTYDNNVIDLEAVSSSSTVWGIQAAPSYSGTPSTDITVTNNDITVNGASAIGVGINGGNSTIKDNTIDVTAADNETIASIRTYDTVGTGNSGVKLTGNASADVSGNYINSNQNNMDLAGAGSDTKIGTNYVTEYVEKEGNPDLPAAPKATSITVQSATVTADPNGKSKTQNIAITVKDANGNPVAGQTIQVYVNGALKTAKTNDKGVATLAVPYKAGGTVSLVASFNGATGLLGSSATGKLTVKKNAVKIAAKTKKVKKSKAKKAKVKFTLKVGKTALKKKAVTIKINKKTYKAKTNAKGIVTFKVKLPKKAKKYKYTVKFAGDNFNKAKTFKGKLTVK